MAAVSLALMAPTAGAQGANKSAAGQQGPAVGKGAPSQAGQQVCQSLATAELELVQAAKLKARHASESPAGDPKSAQCLFEMTPASKSVSLQVIRDDKQKGHTAELWKKKFHPDANARKEAGDEDEASEREEKGRKKKEPTEVDGVGDEAFWVDTGRDGALYALKSGRIYRLSLGGGETQEKKRAAAARLAKSAIAELDSHLK